MTGYAGRSGTGGHDETRPKADIRLRNGTLRPTALARLPTTHPDVVVGIERYKSRLMTARPSDDPTELFTEERHCQVTPGDTDIDVENTGIPCTSLRPQCHAAADDAWPEDDSAKRFLAKAALRAKP